MEEYEDVYQELDDGSLKKIERGALTRPCKPEEALSFRAKETQYQMHQYIEIESQHPIEKSDVEAAVKLLVIKNPVLQLFPVETSGKCWFQLLKKPPFHLEFGKGDVDEIFRQNFHHQFDMDSQALWKVIFTYPKDETSLRYGIILIVHHSIAEVPSCYILLGYMARYLAKDQTLINRKATSLPAMMLEPLALSKFTLIPHVIKHWIHHISSTVRHNFPTRSDIFKNLEAQGGDPSPLALYETLTESDTKTVLQKCKAHGISVNSCITIACCISLIRASNEKKRSKKKSHHISLGFPINIRRHLPEIYSEIIGLYGKFHYAFLKSTENLDETFWPAARAFHEETTYVVRNKRWAPLWLYRYITGIGLKKNLRNAKENKTLLHSMHFVMNNMGLIDKYFQVPDDSTLKVVSVRRMAFDMHWFHPLVLGLDTFRNRIQLKISYSEMNIKTEDAQAIFRHLLVILKEIVTNDKF